MKRVLFSLLSICVGALGAGAWHQANRSTQAATFLKDQQWQAATGQLVAAQSALAMIRGEVQEKKHRMKEATPHPSISPELLALVEGTLTNGSPSAWAQLRQQLGIGWNSSTEYVLVSKRILKGLAYSRLSANPEITTTACDLLAISSTERAALNSVLRANLEQSLRVTVSQPGGDIVAQYTVQPPDPRSEMSVSNNVLSGLIGALGSERTSLILPGIWREFRSHLGPPEAETVTVRRSMLDGQPDLVWEASRGNNVVSTAPVRYAHYPQWFLEVFPGGWQTLADRAGFELPSQFYP